MSLLHLSSICFRYDDQGDWLLQDVSFDINAGDRVVVVGNNGSGKSTLIRLISGTLEPFSGSVIRRDGLSIGELQQELAAPSNATLLDVASSPDAHSLETACLLHDSTHANFIEAMTAFTESDGWSRQIVAHEVLGNLGIARELHELPYAFASGGQRSLVQFARLLCTPADLLLIDEPTNHLDANALAWLQQFVTGLNCAVVSISHDRSFLQSVAKRVVEIRDHTSHTYNMTWDEYEHQRSIETTHAWSEFEVGERRRLATERAAANRMKLARSVLHNPDGKSTQNDFYRSKAKRVERTAKVLARRLERQPPAPKPRKPLAVADLRFASLPHGPEIPLHIDELQLGFGKRLIVDNFTLIAHRGERLHISGANGSGKSTLLKCIVGVHTASAGTINLGHNTRAGYFAQESEHLDASRSPLELGTLAGFSHTATASMLASLRIKGTEIHTKLELLSPGKRAGTALALILLQSPDLLVLDEPNNHLDLELRTALTVALNNYCGTIVFASHDRWFASAIATRTITLHSEGS